MPVVEPSPNEAILTCPSSRISAAEHYENVFNPFQRYRKFAPELENYQQQLGCQKTIFRNECHWLLAALIGRQNAREMLKDSHHSSWVDPNLDEKLSRQLGESGAACKTIIDLIQAKLKIIEEETESFGLVIQQSIPLGSIGDKAWRSRVGKKLKFSFSEPRLEKSLKGLRTLNNDFRILAAQTSRLDNQHQNEPVPIVARGDKKLEESRMIQKMSGQLYGALARACRLHEEHSAHFRLESQHVDIEHNGFSLVRFNMAFAHRSGGASTVLEPVWLAVDSTIDSTLPEQESDNEKARPKAQKSLNDLSNQLKRDMSPPYQATPKRLKGKSVRFEAPVCMSTVSSKEAVLASFITDSALPDFCVRHDLCKQLQDSNTKAPTNKYLGYLEKSGSCKHLVYFAPPIACSPRQSISLAQIVTSVSQKAEADQFLQYERLRLARQLASAVLQFHATPLLKRTWRSDAVVFFGEAASPRSIASPHLNVQVGSKNAVGLLESNVLNADTVGFIRNPYLFGLGVTLIELAYQAPLQSLREDKDLTNGQESKHTDFFIADRLSKSMGTSLGVNYAKVVRKCLGCDFGEGTTDLNDPDLQAVFYKDVVCELERLERAFVMLQLAT